MNHVCGLQAQTKGADRVTAIRAAFTAYSNIRMDRTQWVAESSRVIGELLEWRYSYLPTMNDWEKCEAELTWRPHRIWNYDHHSMLQLAKPDYERLLTEREPEMANAHYNGMNGVERTQYGTDV